MISKGEQWRIKTRLKAMRLDSAGHRHEAADLYREVIRDARAEAAATNDSEAASL